MWQYTYKGETKNVVTENGNLIAFLHWAVLFSSIFTNLHLIYRHILFQPVPSHSPTAQTGLLVCCCRSLTTWALWVGEQRQQTTAGLWQASSMNSCQSIHTDTRVIDRVEAKQRQTTQYVKSTEVKISNTHTIQVWKQTAWYCYLQCQLLLNAYAI